MTKKASPAKSSLALIEYGHAVEFLPESISSREKRADCYLNNSLCKMNGLLFLCPGQE